MDYLFLSQEEFSALNLPAKETALYNLVQRIRSGEDPLIVATETLKLATITSQDLRIMKKHLKQNRPTLAKRPIDVVRKRGKL